MGTIAFLFSVYAFLSPWYLYGCAKTEWTKGDLKVIRLLKPWPNRAKASLIWIVLQWMHLINYWHENLLDEINWIRKYFNNIIVSRIQCVGELVSKSVNPCYSTIWLSQRVPNHFSRKKIWWFGLNLWNNFENGQFSVIKLVTTLIALALICISRHMIYLDEMMAIFIWRFQFKMQ